MSIYQSTHTQPQIDAAVVVQTHYTTKELGDALGCSYKTVENLLNKKGIVGRTRNTGRDGAQPLEYPVTPEQILIWKQNFQMEKLSDVAKQAIVVETIQELSPQQKVKLAHAAMEAALAALEQTVTEQKILLDDHAEWASVKRMEAVFKTSFPWRPLKNYCTANGLEIRKVQDQNYGEVNSYHKDVWLAVYDKWWQPGDPAPK